MVVNEVKCINGEMVSFEETPYYFKLTIGNKTWYWNSRYNFTNQVIKEGI